MKTLLIAASALTLVGAATTAAQAQTTTQTAASTPQSYASVGIVSIDTHKTDAQLQGLNARIGTKLTQNFGVEGEAAFGTNSDDNAAGTYKLTHKIGAYGVGYVPVGDFDLFARAGLSDTQLKSPAGTVRNNESTTAVDYGVGAQYHMNPSYALRADITKSDYVNHHGSSNATTLSLVKAF